MSGNTSRNVIFLLLGSLTVITSAQTEEFRAAWIATVFNIDWPSQPGVATSTAQSELISMLDLMSDLKMNAVFFQVRPQGDALYDSPLEPWSRFLTGQAGQPPSPLWDPLHFIASEAHSRGIEVHAWLNPYRGNTAGNTNGLPIDHPCIVYRSHCYPYGNSMWMDPGAQEIADHTFEVVMDITTRYDVDGIHFDDYFYPYPIDGVPFPDSGTYNDYLSSGGDKDLDDWRRDNVNRLIQRCYEGIHSVKPSAKFSIAPFGLYRPCDTNGMPCSIVGFDPYSELFADALWWLKAGWVDAMIPQLYWRDQPAAQSYTTLLDWWTSAEVNPLGRHIYAGNALYRIEEQDWPVSEITNQIAISRSMSSRNSLGNVQFSFNLLMRNYKGVADTFQSDTYAQPATIPGMPWLPKKRAE